jgi:hypothetical protein
METLLDMIPTIGGGTNVVVMALVFLPTALIAFFVMRAVRVRGTVGAARPASPARSWSPPAAATRCVIPA